MWAEHLVFLPSVVLGRGSSIAGVPPPTLMPHRHLLRPTARIDAIERAHTTLGLPYVDIARLLLTGESTLYRWRAGTTAPTGVNRARLTVLDEFVSALERAFPDEATASAWLDAPLAPLGGRQPRVLLAEGRVELLVGVLAVLAPGAVILAAPMTQAAMPAMTPPAMTPPMTLATDVSTLASGLMTAATPDLLGDSARPMDATGVSDVG